MQKFSHYLQLLDENEIIADVVRTHPEKTAAQAQLDCIDIEVFGRSPKLRTQVVPVAELFVVDSGGALRLQAWGRGKNEQYIRLLSPPVGGASIRTDPLAIFSFPRFFSGLVVPGAGRTHIPRLVGGRIVVQRELWRVDAKELILSDSLLSRGAHDLNQLIAVKATQKQLGIPRYVFAKVSGERKPFLVDFESPILVRQLVRLVRHKMESVEFSEMLPGPDDLWLAGADGHVCSELRLALFSTRADRR